MSLGNEFQVCLPSNVPGNDTNTPGKYETTLARPLELTGSWECALIDVSYPHNWFNIDKECVVLISGMFSPEEKALLTNYTGNIADQDLITATSMYFKMFVEDRTYEPRVSMKLKPGQYMIKNITDMLQASIRSIEASDTTSIVSYDSKNDRVKISGNKRNLILSCNLNSNFFKMLGYNSQTTQFYPTVLGDNCNLEILRINLDPIEAKKPTWIPKIESIFLYSNITNHVLVGNTQTPLLGYFPVQTMWGQQGYWNFNPLYYLSVKETFVHTIQIRMCKDTGEDIIFGSGSVICRLNFRRVGTLRGIV